MPGKGETQKEPWAWDVSESETAKRDLTDSGHHRGYGLLKKKKKSVHVRACVCTRVCVCARVHARVVCVCLECRRAQEFNRPDQEA